MRRYYLLALFLGCAALGLVKVFAGGHSLQSSKTEINFWNGWTGPDGRSMLSVIRRFNEENPDIEVSMQRIDWATYYNKLMVSAMSDRGPQVFVIHASTLPRMDRAGFLDDIKDIYNAKTGIQTSDYEQKVLDQVKFGNRVVAVPLDIHPQGLYCNTEVLLKAGLKNADGTPRPPTNREEFIAAIKACQKIAPDGDHDEWGFSWTMWRNNFMMLLPQFGGYYFDKSGNPDLANPGNVAALDFMSDLMNKEKLTPTPESNMGWVGFRQKKVAMVFEGVYMIGDLKSIADLRYVGAPAPMLGDRKGSLGDSHCLCVRANLTPKEREASERFIAFLCQNSLKWAEAGQVPARVSIRSSEAFKKMQVQYAFSKEVPYMTYPPRSPLLFELTQEIDNAVEKVLRGRTTAKEALTIANQNLVEDFARDKKENKL